MKLKIQGKNLKIENKEIIVSGNQNSYELEIEASEEYSKCACSVVFAIDDVYVRKEVVSNKVTIPFLQRVPSFNRIYVGFFGTYIENNKKIEINSANLDYLEVVQGSYKKYIQSSEDLEPTLLEEYLQKMKDFYKTSEEEYIKKIDEEISAQKNNALRELNEVKENAINEIEDVNTGLKHNIENIEENISELKKNKVDKDGNKQLSDENYTLAEKEKLANLKNYDDTNVKKDIENIQEKFSNYYPKEETYSINQINNTINTLENKINKNLDNKVDKDGNKQLSDENYTLAEKEKLANLKNYDDTNLKKEVEENSKARHTHANKEILDKTTASYTTEKDEMITQHENELANLLSKSTDIEKAIENYLALTPDNGEYIVEFPLWETSQTCTGEKLGANADKFLKLATDTEYEETNYGQAFETYDCNAYVDDDGIRHITALKGMKEFKDIGKVNVFVLGRTYYQKFEKIDGKMRYSRSFVPREGYKVCPMSINKDGSISPYWLIAKYVAGAIDDNGTRKLYSSKGLIPAHYINTPVGSEAVNDSISYGSCITLFKKSGKYYSAASAAEYMHILTTIWLKFATKNSQSIIAGNTINSYQYKVSKPEENVNRVVLTKAQANNIDVNSYVSVGDPTEEHTNHDRVYGYMHSIAYNVKVIGKEDIDEENTALILDHDPITTTATTYVSTMHEVSGYSDYILGRNGSITSNTNGKHGAVIDGIECFVGGYEVAGNVVVDINAETTDREIYIINDATKLSSAIATVKSSYKKSPHVIPCTQATWKYITDVELDLENGVAIPVAAGESGSGSNTGFADGLYTDNSASGQRELLLLGSLSYGANAGASICILSSALSSGYWNILARPSINLVGGELVVDD